jgi:hypothetical protein
MAASANFSNLKLYQEKKKKKVYQNFFPQRKQPSVQIKPITFDLKIGAKKRVFEGKKL